jgi:hypothetical protein
MGWDAISVGEQTKKIHYYFFDESARLCVIQRFAKFGSISTGGRQFVIEDNCV